MSYNFEVGHCEKFNLKTRHYLLIGAAAINIGIILFAFPIVLSLIFIDFVFLVLWLSGWSSSCPKCGSYYSRTVKCRNFLGTHREQKKQHHEKESNADFMITRKVREQEPIVYRHVQNHYKCKRCSHEWLGKVHDEPR